MEQHYISEDDTEVTGVIKLVKSTGDYKVTVRIGNFLVDELSHYTLRRAKDWLADHGRFKRVN